MTFRARAGDPVPEISITKALRIGVEEVGVLFREGYKAGCNKLNCCTEPLEDDDEEHNSLLRNPNQSHRVKYGTNSTRSSDSTCSRNHSSKSTSNKGSSLGSAKTATQPQNDGSDEDDNEVPPEFQGPQTPPTPPSWKFRRSKMLVADGVATKDQVTSVQLKPECWPPSYPGVERNNFGGRFYDSP